MNLSKANPNRGDYAVVCYSGSDKIHVATITKRVEHKHRDDLWDGEILCAARPRYYFKLVRDNKIDRCAQCFRRWKLAGCPTLLGFTPDDVPNQGDIELPWGWREVTPIGCPEDDKPTSDSMPKKKELRRFQRGLRIVRISEVTAENLDKYLRFAIQSARVGKEMKNTRYDADFNEQLRRAKEWMWLGGSPKD